MRYLFIIQGEGRGHLTQAISLRQKLEAEGHTIVATLVGKSPARQLPAFFTDRFPEVQQFESPNFLPQAAGKRTCLPRSIAYNILRTPRYLRSIQTIRHTIRQAQPDVVVNFYELLAGLTYAILPPDVPMVCIAHQYSFLHPDYQFPPLTQWRWWDRPQAAGELWGLRFFTRLTALHASKILALSLRPMASTGRLTIMPPLLRQEVLQCTPERGDYLHTYLLNTSYATQIEHWHQQHPHVPIHCFWDKRNADKTTTIDANLQFHTLDDRLFLHFMARCRAYATTAGFESVCEAIYLGKPVLLVPTHIEQQCNAYDTLLTATAATATHFDLDQLAELATQTAERPAFRHWVHHAEYAFVPQLEHPITQPTHRSHRRVFPAYGQLLRTIGAHVSNRFSAD